ncbi:MAG: MbnP family protein [Bacteroidota bacterium]
MKRIPLFVILFSALLSFWLASCENTKAPSSVPVPGYLQINVTTSFNGQPFNLNQTYTNIQNYRLQVQSLAFLMHQFFAKNANGDVIEIEDAMRYDRSAGAVSAFTFGMAPGNYQGISFAIGIDSVLNHSDPALLAADHPFSYNISNDLHWGWSTGYIFLKMEGFSDTSGTGTGPFDHAFLYHIGVDELFRRFDFYSNDFTIKSNQTTTLTIDLDVAKMFCNGVDTIDLKTENNTQSSGNMPLARQFVSVYEDAFSVY